MDQKRPSSLPGGNVLPPFVESDYVFNPMSQAFFVAVVLMVTIIGAPIGIYVLVREFRRLYRNRRDRANALVNSLTRRFPEMHPAVAAAGIEPSEYLQVAPEIRDDALRRFVNGTLHLLEPDEEMLACWEEERGRLTSRRIALTDRRALISFDGFWDDKEVVPGGQWRNWKDPFLQLAAKRSCSYSAVNRVAGVSEKGKAALYLNGRKVCSAGGEHLEAMCAVARLMCAVSNGRIVEAEHVELRDGTVIFSSADLRRMKVTVEMEGEKQLEYLGRLVGFAAGSSRRPLPKDDARKVARMMKARCHACGPMGEDAIAYLCVAATGASARELGSIAADAGLTGTGAMSLAQGLCPKCAGPIIASFETEKPKKGIMMSMGPNAYSSNEELPEGKTRCPKCLTVHDLAASRIADRSSVSKEEEIGKKALAQFYENIGLSMDVVHVKCPKCGTTYEITQGK